MITENERWIISFYRNSEITGALFFGRLARFIKASEIQKNITKHFADESAHASYWTQCLYELNTTPIALSSAYQDQYLEAVGVPVNIMEILAITQIFEKRVLKQYTLHKAKSNILKPVENSFNTIMKDEVWHIQWIDEALNQMQSDYDPDTITKTLKKYKKADEEVYGKILKEHEERVNELIKVGV